MDPKILKMPRGLFERYYQENKHMKIRDIYPRIANCKAISVSDIIYWINESVIQKTHLENFNIES